MLKIALGQEPASVEREVTGSFGSFFVVIQPLTLGQRARYWSAQLSNDFEEVIKTRIEHVIGWRDVVDDKGADIPFNKENFQKLLGANEDVFVAVEKTVHGVFDQNLTAITDAEQKN